MNFRLVLVGLIAIAVVAAVLLNSNILQLTGKASTITYKSDLVVSVNGNKITAQDVDAQYEKIPPEMRTNITKDQVLNSLIDEKILLLEAIKKGITTTDEEVDQYIDQIKSVNNFDDATLEEKISEQGYSIDEYRQSVKNLLTESKLLTQQLNLQNIKASDSEVNDYLQKNQETFQDFYNENNPELLTMLKEKIQLLQI